MSEPARSKMLSQSTIEIKVQSGDANPAAAAARQNIERAAWRRKAVVSIVAISLVLAVMEAGARCLIALGKPAMFATKSMDAKVRIAELSGAEGKPRVLFLGSSMTTRAVYPELMNERWRKQGLDAVAYNLGSPGVYPMDELFLLRKAAENGSAATVSTAVVEISPWYLAPKLIATGVYSEQFKNSYEGALIANRTPDVWASMQRWFARHSYLVRYRSYLASVMQSALGFVCETRSELNARSFTRVEEEVSPHGWTPSYRILASEGDLRQSIAEREQRMNELFPGGNVDKTNLNYANLDAIAEYCKQRKIRLVLLWLPMHPTYFDSFCRSSGLTDESLHSAFEKLAQHDNATLLDLHRSFEHDDFSDCDHLNVSGALRISPAIADSLNGV